MAGAIAASNLYLLDKLSYITPKFSYVSTTYKQLPWRKNEQ